MRNSFPHKLLLLFVLEACSLLVAAVFGTSRNSVRAETSPAAEPDAACAPCHREIYDRYRQTAMARASGAATAGLIPADFLHSTSGIRYRIFARGEDVYLSYDRETPAPGTSLHGEEELFYFLGSGRRGRTYLFQRQGYWYEIPINWYAKKGIWDMAPKYQQAREMPLTLPIDSSCLHCHASGVQTALPGARNHYAAAPFQSGGITCEACHGDASRHLAQNGHGPILNPDKLAVDRRDSICLQCHLEAELTVNRAGHTLHDFRPGDEISDYVVHFVHRDSVGAGGRATSQWEALLQSACRRQSGDRLTCTTCHDPHSSPTRQEAVTYYRSKCLACHTGAQFATTHHAEQPDCASCHMPRSNTQDIAHEQVTDHRIQLPGGLRLGSLRGSQAPSEELVAVRGRAGARDLGLAYAQLALRGNRQAAQAASRLLRQAEDQISAASPPSDPDLHTDLGVLDQMAGDSQAAIREYALALAADPLDATAAGDTALIDAQDNHLDQAVTLWAQVFAHDPGQKVAAFNLATTDCRRGDGPAAIQVLDRILLFSPDEQKATQFKAAIRDGSQPCSAK